nr:uncharacterized protein LOC109193865 [Ipomoea trifida]
MDSNALSALSAQRSSEDSDLLERSTRKRKVNDGTSGTALPVPAETQPLEDTMAPPSSVEVVGGGSSPAVDLPASAMQIEEVRDGIQSVAADPDSGTPIPPPIANALPRSYLDTMAGVTPPTASPAAGTQGGSAAAGKSKPYGSWMIVTRKDNRPIGRSNGSGKQPETGGRNASAGGVTPTHSASGSRFAPLVEDSGADLPPPQERHERRAGKQPVENGSEVARQPSRARRANVIVNERQIENDRAMARAVPTTETEQVASRQSRGSGSRRAAEEDEHVVIRGEMGGQVIHSTRVVTEDVPTVSNEESADHSREHHTDPPDDFDMEGDVVMEIEDQNGESLTEGGVATPAAAWLTNNGLNDVVKNTWHTEHDFFTNLSRMGNVLAGWNRTVFGNIHHKKKVILARLNGVQRRLANSPHGGLLKLEKKLMDEYHDILYQEELLWFQRSREDWISSGDRNTAFYHAAATIRKSRNTVTSIRDECGHWVTDNATLKSLVRDYYVNLFTCGTPSPQQAVLGGVFPTISQQDWASFNRIVTKEEVHTALFAMAPSTRENGKESGLHPLALPYHTYASRMIRCFSRKLL